MNKTSKSKGQVCGIAALIIAVSAISPKTHALTLNEAIRAAYEYVPAIEAQEYFIAASEQQINLAKSSWRPSIAIEGSATYAEYDNASSRSAGFTDYVQSDSQSTYLTVRQRFYDHGVIANEVKQAQRQYDAEVFDLADRKETLAAQVIASYIDVLRYQELWDTANNNINISEELDSTIRKQVNLGRSAEVDGHLATSQLAGVYAQEDFQYGLLTDARIRFFQLTGLDANNLENIEPLRDFIGMGSRQDPNLLSKLLTQRPDIQAAERRVEAARANVQSQKGNLFPSLDVEFFAGQSADEEYVLGDNNSYGANLIVSWDLYDGGATRAELSQSRSELNAKIKDRDERVRVAEQDIQSALVALSSTEKQLLHVKAEQTASKAVYEAYQQQLITGRRAPLDVFVVLNNYNQSSLRAIDMHYQVIAQQYQVMANYGKLNQFLEL